MGEELIGLLARLPPGEWARPTSATHWNVRDVAAHLLDVDLRRLSSQRDGHLAPPPRPISSNQDLVGFLNHLNDTWVEAARRLSPRILIESLEVSTARVADLLEASDPMAPATFAVAWAGEDTSRMWFDVAREYTERWHHQDQIREAVSVAPLTERRWLRPVLETSLLALPHAFRNMDAAEGTAVLLRVGGESGGEWTLFKQSSWRIESGRTGDPACTIVASDLVVCRLLLHRLSATEAASLVQAEGDVAFVAPLLNARAVMV
ncbi:maleylpyruvate isomerase family mycothiol-dependent enzyme [soil metagenome]